LELGVERMSPGRGGEGGTKGSGWEKWKSNGHKIKARPLKNQLKGNSPVSFKEGASSYCGVSVGGKV